MIAGFEMIASETLPCTEWTQSGDYLLGSEERLFGSEKMDRPKLLSFDQRNICHEQKDSPPSLCY